MPASSSSDKVNNMLCYLLAFIILKEVSYILNHKPEWQIRCTGREFSTTHKASTHWLVSSGQPSIHDHKTREKLWRLACHSESKQSSPVLYNKSDLLKSQCMYEASNSIMVHLKGVLAALSKFI